MAPVVSVIVPCFNYGHLLSEALDSVQRQSLKEWECIVVDDGSGDDTATVARTYCARDPRFSYVRQENRGPSAARNAGFRKASGGYVQLLDADDLLEPEKLRDHTRFLNEQPGYSVVYGSARYFKTQESLRKFPRGRGTAHQGWTTMWPDTTEQMLLALVEGNLFAISAPLFRRSVLTEVGQFDESLPSHEDWDFWLRCAFAGKRFYGQDAPGTRTLIREHSASLSRRAVTMAQTSLEVRQRIEKLAPTATLRERNREFASYDECDLGAAQLAAGHLRAGGRRYYGGFVKARRKARAVQLLLAHLAPGWLLALWRRWRGAGLERQAA